VRVEHRFAVAAAPEDVWSVLRDPESVASCFPGAELIDRGEDGSYNGRITIRFGPTVASFSGRARIDIDDHARSGSIEARGADSRRTTKAVARATVRLQPDGMASAVEVVSQIDVSGPLAGFAEAGGREVTRELLEDFGRQLTARLAASPQSPPPRVGELSAMRLFGRITRRRVRELIDRLFRRGRR